MQLTVKFGATVVADLEGHSATNGAVIPSGSTIALTSNDTTVATVPDTVAVPDEGAESILDIPVTILAAGSTDIHVVVTTPDGIPYEDVAQLLVEMPIPGLLTVTITLRQTSPVVAEPK